MKLIYNVQCRCPKCGCVMENDHDNTTRCTFVMCSAMGVRYDLPTIELQQSAKQPKPQSMTMD